MKTAIIMTGQARTLGMCLPSLHWHVFRKVDDPHFFVSVASEPEASQVEMLAKKYPGRVTIEEVVQPNLAEPPASMALHAPFPLTPTKTPRVSPLQGICRQLWHLSRGYRFAVLNGLEMASTVIRCRFDLHFHKASLPIVAYSEDFFGPWWGRYGPGVNDRFGVMGQAAAKEYFRTWDKLPDMLIDGCPFHPETLVGESMGRGGITIRNTLCAEFAIQRADGSRETMLPSPGEVAEYSSQAFYTQ